MCLPLRTTKKDYELESKLANVFQDLLSVTKLFEDTITISVCSNCFIVLIIEPLFRRLLFY